MSSNSNHLFIFEFKFELFRRLAGLGIFKEWNKRLAMKWLWFTPEQILGIWPLFCQIYLAFYIGMMIAGCKEFVSLKIMFKTMPSTELIHSHRPEDRLLMQVGKQMKYSANSCCISSHLVTAEPQRLQAECARFLKTINCKISASFQSDSWLKCQEKIRFSNGTEIPENDKWGNLWWYFLILKAKHL